MLKNGSDVTTAAKARAILYQKRKIAVCGYHGWHDWYIGSTSMDNGVPIKTKGDTLRFEFNNINSLKKLFKNHKIAGVIIEPLSINLLKDNF